MAYEGRNDGGDGRKFSLSQGVGAFGRYMKESWEGFIAPPDLDPANRALLKKSRAMKRPKGSVLSVLMSPVDQESGKRVGYMARAKRSWQMGIYHAQKAEEKLKGLMEKFRKDPDEVIGKPHKEAHRRVAVEPEEPAPRGPVDPDGRVEKMPPLDMDEPDRRWRNDPSPRDEITDMKSRGKAAPDLRLVARRGESRDVVPAPRLIGSGADGRQDRTARGQVPASAKTSRTVDAGQPGTGARASLKGARAAREGAAGDVPKRSARKPRRVVRDESR